MKHYIISLLLFFSLSAYCQTNENEYHIYNIVIISGNLKSDGFRVDLDNGKEVKKLVNESGKRMKFRTPAAVLMYFISQGWEIYKIGNFSEGVMGLSTSYPYCIIRKPCSKEEFDSAVQDGITQ